MTSDFADILAENVVNGDRIIARAITERLGVYVFAARRPTDDGALWEPEPREFARAQEAAAYVDQMRESGFACWLAFTESEARA